MSALSPRPVTWEFRGLGMAVPSHGTAVPSASPARCSPSPGLVGARPMPCPLARGARAAHAWGSLLIPLLLLHPALLVGAPFRSLRGGLRFGVLFLTPQAAVGPCWLCGSFWTSFTPALACLYWYLSATKTSCYPPLALRNVLAVSFACFQNICLYLLLLKTSAGFPIPSSKPCTGFSLVFSRGNRSRAKCVNWSVRQA